MTCKIARFLSVLLVSMSLLGTSSLAQASNSYPNRTISIIIGFGAGSGTDILACMVAQHLGEKLGQPVIVENKPGASAMIAASYVAKAKPDGYTLLLTSNSSHSINPHIFKEIAYDPLKDFTPIGGTAYFPFILAVDASLPIHSLDDLVQYAKDNKGDFYYAYSSPAVQVPAETINRHHGGAH